MKQEVLIIILPFLFGVIFGLLLLSWILKRNAKKQIKEYEKEITTFTIVCQLQDKDEVIAIMQKYSIVYSENIEGDHFLFKIQGARKQMDALRNDINAFSAY